MKKFISFLLTIIMVFSMAVSVLRPAEPMMTPEKSRSIMQWRETYKVYQLLVLESFDTVKKHMLIKQFQPGKTG